MPGPSTLPSPLGELVFRPEREDDAGFRYRLFRRSRGPEWDQAGLPPELLEQIMQHQFHAQTVGYRDQFPQAAFDIIELDGAPIGRLVVDRPGGRLHLVDIAVLPEHRGQGLGGGILRALLDEAAAAGVPVRLEVSSENEPSLSLYLRLGFRETARNEMYLQMEWRAAWRLSRR